jgi:hypothetical protein
VVELWGVITVSAQTAMWGSGVWMDGTLKGTVVVPAGQTLNVGNDVWNPGTSGVAQPGVITIPVSGAGTLNVAGTPNLQCPGGFVSTNPCPLPTIAGDLSGIAAVRFSNMTLATDLRAPAVGLFSSVTLAPKADGSATVLGATVPVTGPVTVACGTTVQSTGTVQLGNGGSVSSGNCATESWQNSGTLSFVDSGGASFAVSGQGFVNLAGGQVVKSGSAARDVMQAQFGNPAPLENDGSVVSQSGLLVWNSLAPPSSPVAPYDGVSAGSFGSSGSGVVELWGVITVSAQTTWGNGAWMDGTLKGTVVVPAGQTLNVGNDVWNPGTSGVAQPGVITIPVSGAGTLNVAGTPNLQCPGGFVSTNPCPLPVIAIDLDSIPNVQIANATIARKADGSPTFIGSQTTVTLVTTPTLASGLSLVNNGTLNFGANDYFTCSNCTVTNSSASATSTGLPGFIQLNNPDGYFDHTFTVNSGTFDNQGVIKFTGFYPATAITFGSAATVVHRGQAEYSGLAFPEWVDRLRSDATVTLVANALANPTGGVQSLEALARNASLAGAAALTNLGVGSCTNANVAFGIPGASLGACFIAAPDGTEGIALSLSGSGIDPWPSEGTWDAKDLFHGADYTIDAGAQVFWKTGQDGSQRFHLPTPDDASNDVDGPSWCENGTLTAGVGIVGQHCWGPSDGVPFDLTSLVTTRPGLHSAYLGVSTGEGAALAFVLGWSALVTCGRWATLTQLACPPANTLLPAITGSPAVGQTLSASSGTWTLVPMALTYQWQRCTLTSTSSCADIPGATSPQYTVAAADRGNYVRVTVTATNLGGSTPASSTLLEVTS